MNLTETLKKTLENRRSIYPKDYAESAIPQHILDDILQAADTAPNHKKTRPWRFKLFLDEEKDLLAQEMQKIYKTRQPEHLFLEKKYNDIGSKIRKSPAVISIVVNFSGVVPEWEEIAAVSMAVQNMYLMCTAHGMGCYWSSLKFTEYLEESVHIEENQKCLGLFYMGMLA